VDPSAPDSTCSAPIPGDAQGFVAFDGYFFDRQTWTDEPDVSDAAALAMAFPRRRETLFDRLRGAFTLAVWDEQRRRLLVGRDALGLSPCFYCWNGRVFLVSPSLDTLLHQPDLDSGFNRIVLAEQLQNMWPAAQAHETLYAGVRRLPSAHVLTLTSRGLVLTQYWDPLPPGFAWATDEQARAFPLLLERAVGRCLDVGADGIALSGGFDSVSLAVLAAERRRDRRPLHAVSLRFDGGACDEGRTQAAVARSLGMPQLLRSLTESLDGQDPVAASLALSAMSPSPVLSVWQSFYSGLFRSASDLGLRRLMFGTGGDDLFNVDLAYGADRLAALDARGLWRFFRSWQRTSPFSGIRVARAVLWQGAIVPETRRLLRSILACMPSTLQEAALARWRRQRRASWIGPADPDLVVAIDQRQRTNVPPPLAPGERAYVRALRFLTQAPLLHFEHDQSHAWARGLGFTFLFPYFDRDLVELSLRLHPEHLIAGGRAKTPLRRLVAERLPSVTMPVKKVDFTQIVHQVLRPHGHAVWRELGGARRLAEMGIVHGHKVDRFMEDYFAGRNDNSRRAWSLLSSEMWVRARSCGLGRKGGC
jgi:asparagine synthase (glutamine-hydrolysing)